MAGMANLGVLYSIALRVRAILHHADDVVT